MRRTVCDNPAPLQERMEWHWGDTGTGKTRGLRERFPEAYTKSNNLWWCGYQYEPEVIIDEMGPKQIGAHHLK